jgi:hypothetical protein
MAQQHAPPVPAMIQPHAFPAEYPHCPKCNQTMRRLTGSQGSFYATCDNSVKIVTPGHNYPRVEKCGQTVHVVAVEGVVFVTAISKEQYRRFKSVYARARDVYAEHNIITLSRADGHEVPEHACSSCGTPTKLFDLYGGECRKCHGEKTAS